ncbi:MAG: TIGR02453 family protein [Flavobacterium sp.]|uniref:DUF2461 domain-containing protein n=1 Tax=unclassified Flavobacterium TaxID=196869 RepID=UPI000C55E518|nr:MULTISPECIES: DUF2461 domain-containing protein [unclassified Flavobacterium]MBF04036.1 TIGR02453 family protein [Flavobacterium sp.]MCO6163418.1 DUF2461 domain-containing protein [Flavobacterium sp. NRK F7]|tara:strand:- start:186 stop:860 length:675 start_codon:yes stop_codon:yes gene_type:complete
MSQINQESLSFLLDLKENNNREWFAENKKRYDKQSKFMKQFFTEVGEDLGKIDHIEHMQIFRIYRDVRFSKNKLPYKVNFSAAYRRTKPLLRGGYYLHIENDKSFVGGGFWEPNVEDLLRIRKELELDASEFRAITSEATFKTYFGSLEGEELKTAPRDFDKNHPNIDLIRKKQFLVTRSFTNEEVLASNFKEEVIATFQAMRPFFNYMSDVLTTNLNGESLYS